MSIMIKYNNGKLEKCDMECARKTPSPTYMSEDKHSFVVGEFFNTSVEEIVNKDWKNNPKLINDITGNISVAYADESNLYAASNLCGIDTFYYYHKGSTFIVSDSFWDIVKKIKPEFEDLNQEWIKKWIVTFSQKGETFINNLNIIMPNEIIKYDVKNNKLDKEIFYRLHYTSEINDIDEAVERMDTILTESMRLIKEKCGDVTYGIGISGGLDSRIIPHYAKAAGLKIEGFNTCVAKPHHLFYARSAKNGLELAKIFNVPYTNVNWNPKTVEYKIQNYKDREKSDFVGEAFKLEKESMPEFDVLLSGASGGFVGADVPANYDSLTPEALIDIIKEDYTFSNLVITLFRNKIRRGLNYIFGINLEMKQKKNFHSLLNKIYEDNILKEVDDAIEYFVKDRQSHGMSMVDIYQDYSLNIISFLNRYGAFESQLGTKRSFSIYLPFMVNETLKWNPKLFVNRVVLTELINKKVTETMDVKSESFQVAPGKKNNGPIKKAISLFLFTIRGNGTGIDHHYLKKRSMKKCMLKYINSNETTWFKRIFNYNELFLSDLSNENHRIMSKTWELKAFIDYLEKKEYLK